MSYKDIYFIYSKCQLSIQSTNFLLFGIYYYMYIHNPCPSTTETSIPQTSLDTKQLQVDNTPVNEIPILPSVDKIPTSVPKIDTKSYTPVSSIHSTRSSEVSSPASQRSDISEGCKNAINELMSKCIDL